MDNFIANKKTFLGILDDLPTLKEFWVESDDIIGCLKIELNEESLLTWVATIDNHLTIGVVINVYSIWIALLGYYKGCTSNCDYINSELMRLKSLINPHASTTKQAETTHDRPQ